MQAPLPPPPPPPTPTYTPTPHPTHTHPTAGARLTTELRAQQELLIRALRVQENSMDFFFLFFFNSRNR